MRRCRRIVLAVVLTVAPLASPVQAAQAPGPVNMGNASAIWMMNERADQCRAFAAEPALTRVAVACEQVCRSGVRALEQNASLSSADVAIPCNDSHRRVVQTRQEVQREAARAAAEAAAASRRRDREAAAGRAARAQAEQEARARAAYENASARAAPAEGCGPVLPRWEKEDYGSVFSALEQSCAPVFSQKEQLVIAGAARALLDRCDLPKGLDARLKLADFLTSAELAAGLGSQYANPDLSGTMGDQLASGAAYSVGQAAIDGLESCGALASTLSAGVMAFLDHTASADTGYVDGCVAYYGGRYSRAQCQCLADSGRVIYPDIYKSRFTRDSIYNIIQANPMVALKIGVQCGIGDY